ncbi:MAG: ADP-ribosylglycohydrolase family protein [Planctomycetes bacterium]|nr:ADP-ribosylglycohydrolase family protein [Planctomycetota bacterium]
MLRPRASNLVGCLLGGAVGDALGGAYEGRVGPIELDRSRPLRPSDDTQLTLATCAAIEAGGTVTPEGVAARLLDGYRSRRFSGLGASTLKALRDLDAGAHWYLSGRGGEMSAGNGAAMRVAPLAFVLDPDDAEGRRLLRDVCRITHHNDEAYSGALAIVCSIRAMLAGDRGPHGPWMPHVAEQLPDSAVRDAIRSLAALPSETPIQEVAARHGCSGSVAESVPLALYAAQRVEALGFEGVLRASVSAGGDTDTIASMAGQVMGARLGVQGIPGELSQRVEGINSVLRVARELAARLGLPE